MNRNKLFTPDMDIRDWWDRGEVLHYAVEETSRGNMSPYIAEQLEHMYENNDFNALCSCRDYDYARIRQYYTDWVDHYNIQDRPYFVQHNIVGEYKFSGALSDYWNEHNICMKTPDDLGKIYCGVVFSDGKSSRKNPTVFTYYTYDVTLKVGDKVNVPVKNGASRTHSATGEIVEIYGNVAEPVARGLNKSIPLSAVSQIFSKTDEDSSAYFSKIGSASSKSLTSSVLCIAEYNHWQRKGRSTGARVSESQNLISAFRQLPEPEMVWYLNWGGDLCARCYHVWGTNKYTFRGLNTPWHSTELNRVLSHLNDPSTERIDDWTWLSIDCMTYSLGPLAKPGAIMPDYSGPLPDIASHDPVHCTLRDGGDE